MHLFQKSNFNLINCNYVLLGKFLLVFYIATQVRSDKHQKGVGSEESQKPNDPSTHYADQKGEDKQSPINQRTVPLLHLTPTCFPLCIKNDGYGDVHNERDDEKNYHGIPLPADHNQ